MNEYRSVYNEFEDKTNESIKPYLNMKLKALKVKNSIKDTFFVLK